MCIRNDRTCTRKDKFRACVLLPICHDPIADRFEALERQLIELRKKLESRDSSQ